MPLRTRSVASNPPRPPEIVLDFATPSQQALRPLTRRLHHKSKLGCLTCKRRRVKCTEERPVCAQCTRLELECTYSQDVNSQWQPRRQEDGQLVADHLRICNAVGSSLSLEQLKLYDHFAHAAYPLTPIQGKEGYMHCMAMSHKVAYLSHALLALAATHLTVHTNEDYTRKALHHRVAALNLVNKRLSEPVETIADADALLAAMCCLTSESALSTDTMPDYLSLVRGSYLMSQSFVMPLHSSSLEKSIWNNTALEVYEHKLTTAVQDQAKDLDLIQDFQRSVGSLRPICKHDFEFLYQQGLWRAITALPTSSVEATKWFFFVIVIPNQLPSSDFISFTRKDNFPGQLLLVHMFMLDYLLGQTCIVRDRAPKFGGRKWAILGWIRQLARSLPAAYRDFAEFPLRFCDAMDACDSRYLFLP